MVDEKEKENCSGCTACISACPTGCIEMRKDGKGFLYPYIHHDHCIQCGLCDKVCEAASLKKDVAALPKGFGAYAKDEKLRLNSSSGGIFTLIADKVLEMNGVIAGASFTKDFRSVRHIIADSKEQIAAFRGAKYLQSNVGNTFRQIKALLENGRKVLFSGTPCQVDGLKAYLKTDYDNLLCIDIICHGVPSPLVWAKYCDEVENKFGGKLTKVNFRYKKYSWEDLDMTVLNNGKKGFYLSKEEDPYMRLFLKNFSLRPSCYNCSHKGINRKSDITVADFWGVNQIAPELSDGKGTSLLLVHTEKGLMYVNAINNAVKAAEVDAGKAVNLNKSAIRSVKKPVKAAEFWKDFENLAIDRLAEKYVPVSTKNQIKQAVRKTKLYGALKKAGGSSVNMESGLLFLSDTPHHR